ncbi:MAG: endopeptidase La [Archangium gephyra]|uniref:Lon protease n=1 Tax=Archangium gephyra TaxID=48 RepID=A0A2W5SYP2_9BACT|nr:MAG: endopeptidase La [Archangium gephyra]
MFFSRDDKKEVAALPMLPLRDIVLFPHEVRPLYVGREKSIAALKEAMARKGADGKAWLLLAAQKKAKTNDPTPDELFTFATLGQVVQLLPLPDGTVKVLVEGVSRAKIGKFLPNDPFFLCEYERVEEEKAEGVELEALLRAVHQTFKSYVELNKRIAPELQQQVAIIEDPSRLADTIAIHIPFKSVGDKQSLLETESPVARLEKLFELMQGEIEILKAEKRIKSRVKKQMERTQREYFLNEQMQAIQRELGGEKGDDGGKTELQELDEKLKSKKMPKEAHAKVKKEIKKLKLMGPMSAEATVVRNYIDWVLSLPWGDETKDKLDIEDAEGVLNADHYGLKKVKERILEYLAVQQLVGKMKGPILCFVGPPGVGKTSLGRSISKALDRKFVRIALGGVRDEAEIRGHRRTYIGAMPGKIVQSLKKAESSNPVILLDEIDKMSSDFRGDPSAALLEVLDPEQNHTFNDHYLDLDYDLSKVMFICTANSMSGIPQPLQDRMEVIRLAGYTEEEKLAIARRYLVPKTKEANGMADVDVKLTTSALRSVIRRYTREAGVRNLERELAGVFRKLAREAIKNGKAPVLVDQKKVVKLLGTPKVPKDKNETENQVGMVNGLAWTEFGGEVLTTEATTMPGKGKLVVTGLLKDMMKESAQAAVTYVRSKARRFGIDDKFFEQNDMHIHFPGAFPKDGPSAGVTMATALVSAITRIPVRRDVAMTGEITLRGRVTAIGGLKEKCLAAHRLGIKTILIPRENKKDLREIPKKVRSKLRIVIVDYVDEVLREALVLEKPAEFARITTEGGAAPVAM